MGLPLVGNSIYKPQLITDYPDGFMLIIDTRESDPLFFRAGKSRKNVPIIRKTLTYGDYSVLGFEEQLSVERKKAGDLVACLGREWKRFEKELGGLKDMERKYILVECYEEEVYFSHSCQLYMQSKGKTGTAPNAVRQSIASIEMKLGVPFHYSPNRTATEIWIMDRFVKYYQWKRGGK